MLEITELLVKDSGKNFIKKLPVIGKLATTSAWFLKQRRYKNAFLINTMPKSGSHYLMSIIGNYLYFNFLNGKERLGIIELKNRIWNVKKETDELLKLHQITGFSHYLWEHENPFIRFNNAKVIIHTYRNPLDILVSRYFYNYVNRYNYKGNIKSPTDLIDREIPKFIYHYKLIDVISNRKNVKRIAYENLIRSPLDTVKDVLHFSGIPYCDSILEKAIDASSKGKVKADEIRYNVEGSNVVGKNMKESFVRSGKIGEWKEYFQDTDIKKVEDLLKIKKLTLSQFIIE